MISKVIDSSAASPFIRSREVGPRLARLAGAGWVGGGGGYA